MFALRFVQTCVCAHICVVFCENVDICVVINVCMLVGCLCVI